jgi:hypothetical protein
MTIVRGTNLLGLHHSAPVDDTPLSTFGQLGAANPGGIALSRNQKGRPSMRTFFTGVNY